MQFAYLVGRYGIAKNIERRLKQIQTSSPDKIYLVEKYESKLGIEYSRLITPLLKSIQELKSELDSTKAEIELLKQFLPNTQIWVWILNEEDTGYVFDTEQEDEDMVIYLKTQDSSREYKVSTSV